MNRLEYQPSIVRRFKSTATATIHPMHSSRSSDSAKFSPLARDDLTSNKTVASKKRRKKSQCKKKKVFKARARARVWPVRTEKEREKQRKRDKARPRKNKWLFRDESRAPHRNRRQEFASNYVPRRGRCP